MVDPFFINAGQTYLVRFGPVTKQVYIIEREGESLQSYVWNGVILETGKSVHIRNGDRFIERVEPALIETPWVLVIDFDRVNFFEQEMDELEYFGISIRNSETFDLIADFPAMLIDAQATCARVFRDAINMCKKAGSSGTDLEHLHLWHPEGEQVFGKVKLAFDGFHPLFATADYVKALMKKVYEEAERAEQVT